MRFTRKRLQVLHVLPGYDQAILKTLDQNDSPGFEFGYFMSGEGGVTEHRLKTYVKSALVLLHAAKVTFGSRLCSLRGKTFLPSMHVPDKASTSTKKNFPESQFLVLHSSGPAGTPPMHTPPLDRFMLTVRVQLRSAFPDTIHQSTCMRCTAGALNPCL